MTDIADTDTETLVGEHKNLDEAIEKGGLVTLGFDSQIAAKQRKLHVKQELLCRARAQQPDQIAVAYAHLRKWPGFEEATKAAA